MAIIRLTGFDPSMTHWGVASGKYDSATGKLTIDYLKTVAPDRPDGKGVLKSSQDLAIATGLTNKLKKVHKHTNVLFAEIPLTGGKNMRSTVSYGLCIGVIGAMSSYGCTPIQVTPAQVKLIATDTKNANKAQMIEWAVNKHPEAPWPYKQVKGEKTIVAGTAEHMADALAAIYAGLETPQFKQLLPFISNGG